MGAFSRRLAGMLRDILVRDRVSDSQTQEPTAESKKGDHAKGAPEGLIAAT